MTTDIETHRHRREVYANEIGAESEADFLKRMSILLTVCGSQMYSPVRNLCTPQLSSNKSYQQLKDLLQDHLNPN